MNNTTVTTQNYFDAIMRINWATVPASLVKTRDTLIPDVSKNDWEHYKNDEDVRRVVEKYFSYIGKYVSAPKALKPISDVSKSVKMKSERPAVTDAHKERAHDLAIKLIRSYVERGDSMEQLRKSFLGHSSDAGSASIRGNKILVDRIGSEVVHISFSLASIFNEIKKSSAPTPEGAQPKKAAKSKAKDTPRLPEATQVTFIPTATAFIKRYAALHGKVKRRDQLLSLVHGLQKAITEQRIHKSDPTFREIEQMQSELIALVTSMEDSAKIEIVPASLAHYKQIAQGEEVRTSVRLLKSFIAMNGKAYDKTKVKSLLTRMEKAIEVIPTVDPYLKQLKDAMTALSAYSGGSGSFISIPTAALHGLGSLAVGEQDGLGAARRSGESAIVRMLRSAGVRNLSQASLKKALRTTVAPGLSLEIAKSLIKRGALTMDVLIRPAKTARYGALNGPDREITSLDILETRLNGYSANGNGGLGNVSAPAAPEFDATAPVRTPAVPNRAQGTHSTISAKDLAKLKFHTIGYKGRFLSVVGDPAVGFRMMVYGKPFQGKSSFVIELAKELAKLGKGKVAYVCLEEGISLSMQKKVVELGADKVEGLDFMGAMPLSFSGYGFVVIDSVSDRNMSRDHLRKMFLDHPDTCFICIFHATKEGSARGGLDYSHDMDIILRLEAFLPVVEKNRFL